MTGHFTSYENRTDHELATGSKPRCWRIRASVVRLPSRKADDPLHGEGSTSQ
jgi:hypothetical protein